MRRNYGFIIKMILLCLLIIGVIIYFERFRLLNIVVEGGSHYTQEEIESFLVKSSVDKFTHFFYLKNTLFSEPDPIPFVEKLDFEIIDRNTVKVTVYDKVITGCVEHMGRYMHFDREGIVVECADEPDTGVPVITGVDFSKAVIGEPLEVADKSIFKRIQDLTLLLNENGINCQRIHFDIRQNIKLYIGNSEALLGGGDDHDFQIKALRRVLDESDGKNYRYNLENLNSETGEITAKPINNEE